MNPIAWKLIAGYLDGIVDAVFPVIRDWDVVVLGTAQERNHEFLR